MTGAVDVLDVIIRRVVTFWRDHAANLTARKTQTAEMRRK
jgi:hypothetical protein